VAAAAARGRGRAVDVGAERARQREAVEAFLRASRAGRITRIEVIGAADHLADLAVTPHW
jgi:hypothetical protein